jgi:hypothetical protein
MTTAPLRTDPRGWNRPLLALTAGTLLLALVAGAGIFADSRILTGVPVWLKPFKFAVSFAIYAFTLAWLLSVLPRRSRPAEWAIVAIVGVSFTELAIITFQAARGRLSHYNTTTAFDAMLWQVMGMAIMVLFVATMVVGVVALRQRIGDRSVTWAIRLGLALTLLGMLVAFPMTMQSTAVSGVVGAHSVGVPDGGPGMPLTGWSLTGGDLRIGHFVGLHALQALPLLAFLLSRFAGRRLDERTRARLLLVTGLGYGVLVLLLTWQAMRGQPLLKPDAVTLVAGAALLAGTALAAGAVLRLRRRPDLALAA